MKKYIILLVAAALAVAGCQKPWAWHEELSVNSTRINITTAEGNFTVSVFSNTSWTALVTWGADWLKLEEESGSGVSTLHLANAENYDDAARVATLVLTASTGKTIEVSIVQSGKKEPATSIPDNLL